MEKRINKLSDSIRKGNTRIMGIAEGQEREKETEDLFKKIIDENSPNLGKELGREVQEANKTPNCLNTKDLLQDTIY